MTRSNRQTPNVAVKYLLQMHRPKTRLASRFCFAALTVLILAYYSSPSFAQSAESSSGAPDSQTSEPIEDEVIARGQIIVGDHDGMAAFNRGDYEIAEIEFERDFLTFKRQNSARINAIEDAALSIDRSLDQAAAGNNDAAAFAGGPGGAGIGAVSVGATPSTNVGPLVARNQNDRFILNDGELTYDDFAFSKYMAGLSEIKLGKFEEARESLEQSLHYNPKNFDAQMRMGLLNIQSGDLEAAVKNLEKLDKLRQTCEKRDCASRAEIRDATLTLANQLRATSG